MQHEESKAQFVIFSLREYLNSEGEAAFWSNVNGWVGYAGADRFTQEAREAHNELLSEHALWMPVAALYAFLGIPVPSADDRENEEGISLKVSLDGGATYIPARSGVRVIIEGNEVLLEDEDGEIEVEMHCNFTHEGLVTDIVATSGPDQGEVLYTDCSIYSDHIDTLLS